jgi:[Skp1-protein]-hydroxyproline N-acetylglucosaminyltransferase
MYFIIKNDYLIDDYLNGDIIENFDESKVKIGEIAKKRMSEFNYDFYKPYIDKYFVPMDIIDLKKIPVRNDGLIFCSVASYRDKECPLTVIDMINKASKPENLVICICQQNDSADISCMNDGIKDNKAKIIFINLSDRDARGPTHARFLIQQRWTGEEYFLQIDSHMRFEQDWDKKCIDDLKNLPPKSCLTNYVANYNLDTGIPDATNQYRGSLFIVNKETSDIDGFFRVNSDFVESNGMPMLAKGWAACFSFSRSELLHDAPYSNYMPFLFFGEENFIYAVAFTKNWLFYAPSSPICFTSFDRTHKRSGLFWENQDQAPTEFLSRLRLYYIFGYLNKDDNLPKELLINIENDSLGTDKTWQEFLEFTLDD